jgi:hypothetical protein
MVARRERAGVEEMAHVDVLKARIQNLNANIEARIGAGDRSMTRGLVG